MFWETHQQISTCLQTQFHHCVHSLPVVWIMSHTNPEHTLSFLRYILIIVFHLCLSLLSLLSPSTFITDTLYEFLFTPMGVTCPTHSDIFLVYHPRKIWWGLKISKFSSMEYSPTTSYTHPFVHIFSQNTVLRHFPQCYRPSFTPIQGSRQN